MGNAYGSTAAGFLIDTVFGFYILMVLLRFLLQTVRADFYNPICQFLVKLTNPPLRPLRRIVPGWGGIDLASIVLLFALQAVALLLKGYLVGRVPSAAGLALLSTAELLALTLNCFLFTILIQVVLSWVSQGGYHPVHTLLHRLNEPLLGPARRILPPISGIDLSPILVLVAVQLLKILLVAPMTDIGYGLG